MKQLFSFLILLTLPFYSFCQKHLFWQKHLGIDSNTPHWEKAKKQIPGWEKYKFVFGGGNNIIYAIDYSGNIYWFKHIGFYNGESIWENNGIEKKVGQNWGNFIKVFQEEMG